MGGIALPCVPILQAIDRRLTTVRLAGTGVGRRGTIALEHQAGLPASQPYQIRLTAAIGQPLMREGVAELVRMQIRETNLPAAAPQHEHDAPCGQPALEAKPQPGQCCVLVPGADVEVAVECLGGPAVERQQAFDPTFGEDTDDLVVEVEVVELDVCQLGAADGGVQQQHDDGGVAAGVEVLAGARLQQPPQRAVEG
jgi:hypothetical protein